MLGGAKYDTFRDTDLIQLHSLVMYNIDECNVASQLVAELLTFPDMKKEIEQRTG